MYQDALPIICGKNKNGLSISCDLRCDNKHNLAVMYYFSKHLLDRTVANCPWYFSYHRPQQRNAAIQVEQK